MGKLQTVQVKQQRRPRRDRDAELRLAHQRTFETISRSRWTGDDRREVAKAVEDLIDELVDACRPYSD